MPDTIVALAPLLLKDCIIQIGTNDYGEAISSVMFTPSSSTVVFKGLKPAAKFTDMTDPDWTCAITFAQDWDTATSFSRYLMTAAGTTVEMTFKPRSGSGPSFTANIVITPGAIGGNVEQHATSTVTLGVDGSPALVEAGGGS